MCEGSGGPRAWPCISVPEQLRRRGHFASTFFNFRVLLHRCLHAIKPFLGPRYLPRRDATSENFPVAREGQSEPTNSGLRVLDDYRHLSPWSWGWVRGSGKPGVVRPRDHGERWKKTRSAYGCKIVRPRARLQDNN